MGEGKTADVLKEGKSPEEWETEEKALLAQSFAVPHKLPLMKLEGAKLSAAEIMAMETILMTEDETNVVPMKGNA